ncbi:hypothetical protein OG369_43285 [Streptomyces sp. NBC_01221]|uniref:hypothetical protein n=1 Tax=Streptomyces sp. NBC_01221 TaxID=2903782 RepID=UPI00224FF846|nr:hypothetical protein [Streptomyces sp. NBC_01221]MCX4792603.1 hypothetical protein [Streptomyces sp. NBC_01221]
MTQLATPATGYYWYQGSSGGRGLSEARIVHAQAEYHGVTPAPDDSVTVTFERTGTTTHYRPATQEDIDAIMEANRARMDGNKRLGEAVAEVLRAADLQMARYMQRMGSGVHVHTGGSWVVVMWWYSTEAERTTAPAPWTAEDGGVRAKVVAALEIAGLRFSDEGTNGSDVVLTYDNNPHV